MSFIESIIHMQSAVEIVNYNHGTNIYIYRAVQINGKEITVITITDGKNYLDIAFSQCDSNYRLNFTVDELVRDISNKWFKTEGGRFENDRNAAAEKKGKWGKEKWTHSEQHICSECHCIVQFSSQSVTYRYCPYCGVKMETKQEAANNDGNTAEH